MSETTVQGGGFSLVGILTVILFVLKVLEIGVVATWSWWWVFSPIWISILLFLVFILLVVIIAAISAAFDK